MVPTLNEFAQAIQCIFTIIEPLGPEPNDDVDEVEEDAFHSMTDETITP
jgi:hypothetical protein